MRPVDLLTHFTVTDGAALAVTAIAWVAIGWRIEHPGTGAPSVTMLMSQCRRDWMRVMVTRDPRVFDSQIVGSLRQGAAFFASTALLAIGGVLALVGNTDPLQMVAAEISAAETPVVLWQAKLGVVALFMTNAFLKFVWANRVFGYCAVMMASVPNDPADPEAYPRAAQAAELNIRAAISFNRGMRSMYFGLGTLAWLMGPWPLLAATLLVTVIIWLREFRSLPRAIIEGSST